jgi:hypothetical protein
MTPLPQDPNVPVVDGKTASHDVIISWLAYQEAKSLLDQVSDQKVSENPGRIGGNSPAF